MKKQNKDRVVNIKPFHCELKINSFDGFELWFYSNIGDDYTRRTITKIHLEQWWLRFLAEMLWKVIGKRQSELDEQKQAMESWN